MESTAKTKRPRPTQAECLEWLLQHEPQMHAEAVCERDWVWVKLGPVPSDLVRLKKQGWRMKKDNTHRLPDGTEASWYHSCQGKWRPAYKKGSKRRKTTCTTNSMSMSDALEVAGLL